MRRNKGISCLKIEYQIVYFEFLWASTISRLVIISSKLELKGFLTYKKWRIGGKKGFSRNKNFWGIPSVLSKAVFYCFSFTAPLHVTLIPFMCSNSSHKQLWEMKHFLRDVLITEVVENLLQYSNYLSEFPSDILTVQSTSYILFLIPKLIFDYFDFLLIIYIIRVYNQGPV